MGLSNLLFLRVILPEPSVLTLCELSILTLCWSWDRLEVGFMFRLEVVLLTCLEVGSVDYLDRAQPCVPVRGVAVGEGGPS